MFSLADAILQQDVRSVQQKLRYGDDINQIDEYGFTPLIEATIVDNVEICQLLLSQGANANLQDLTGNTPLHWAVENNNLPLCKLLLEHRANPNAYNFSGQPILVMPTLREQSTLRKFLIKAGADPVFTQDYINTKLLGHIFELVGTANIVSPDNQFAEVDFEGFYLEITLGLVGYSVSQFQNHFAARQLRRYAGVANLIVNVIQRASALIKYQQYRVDITKHSAKIDALIQQEPLLIPVGYEGHAITFIKFGNIWVKCDRREDSRLYDNIMFYRITNTNQATPSFFKKMIFEKQDHDFINHELDRVLGLQPITELKVEAQISGNCSWANVEATIPAIFFMVMMQYQRDTQAIGHYKTLALNFFHRWRDWNQDRSLQLCIQRFKESDSIRKACHAEILVAILFQRLSQNAAANQARIETILSLLRKSPYEYVVKNYLRIYYYQSPTLEGRHFADMLKQYDFVV